MQGEVPETGWKVRGFMGLDYQEIPVEAKWVNSALSGVDPAISSDLDLTDQPLCGDYPSVGPRQLLYDTGAAIKLPHFGGDPSTTVKDAVCGAEVKSRLPQFGSDSGIGVKDGVSNTVARHSLPEFPGHPVDASSLKAGSQVNPHIEGMVEIRTNLPEFHLDPSAKVQNAAPPIKTNDTLHDEVKDVMAKLAELRVNLDAEKKATRLAAGTKINVSECFVDSKVEQENAALTAQTSVDLLKHRGGVFDVKDAASATKTRNSLHMLRTNRSAKANDSATETRHIMPKIHAHPSVEVKVAARACEAAASESNLTESRMKPDVGVQEGAAVSGTKSSAVDEAAKRAALTVQELRVDLDKLKSENQALRALRTRMEGAWPAMQRMACYRSSGALMELILERDSRNLCSDIFHGWVQMHRTAKRKKKREATAMRTAMRLMRDNDSSRLAAVFRCWERHQKASACDKAREFAAEATRAQKLMTQKAKAVRDTARAVVARAAMVIGRQRDADSISCAFAAWLQARNLSLKEAFQNVVHSVGEAAKETHIGREKFTTLTQFADEASLSVGRLCAELQASQTKHRQAEVALQEMKDEADRSKSEVLKLRDGEQQLQANLAESQLQLENIAVLKQKIHKVLTDWANGKFNSYSASRLREVLQHPEKYMNSPTPPRSLRVRSRTPPASPARPRTPPHVAANGRPHTPPPRSDAPNSRPRTPVRAARQNSTLPARSNTPPRMAASGRPCTPPRSDVQNNRPTTPVRAARQKGTPPGSDPAQCRR
eukprot:TRINITY_DN32173_c0_g1_i1.p1 TRINITY_DN32173_c0_g1~~TRINITY_DN32173_c0_g1_i1.p1  ORF type:complete len:892 (+),score=137.47 TRINITY_DN32173_c0_g1_i1:361-2676(+)